MCNIKFKNIDSEVGEKYLFIDIETTGLDEKESDIIQVYFKLCSNMKFKPGSMYGKEWLLEYNIIDESNKFFYSKDWEKTKHLTQFKEEDFEGTHKFDSPLNEGYREYLKEILYRSVDEEDDVILVGQYLKFEKKFFKEKLGIDLSNARIYDTKEVEKFLRPRESHKLRDISLRLGISEKELDSHAHNAKHDICIFTENAFKHQIRELLDDYQDQIFY